jgi:hypothetical protein
MLRLSVDTGPEFSLALLSLAENTVMFGHPGISALEFAGSREQRKSVQKTLELRGKATVMLPVATQDDSRPLSLSADTAGSEMVQGEDSQEVSAMQRRRGTFINHTPRTFEMRSPTRTEFSTRNSKDRSSQAYTSSYSSAEASKTTSSSQQWHKSTPSSPSFQDMTGNPAELDSKEISCVLSEKPASQSRTSTQPSVGDSLASTIAGTPKTLSTSRNSRATTMTASSGYRQNTGKRLRRQTPYKILTFGSDSRNGPHSPLQPWMAQRDNVAIESSTSESPPKLNDDEEIAGLSATRAIQEYFDSQKPLQIRKLPDRQCSSSLPNTPLPFLSAPVSPTSPHLPIFPLLEVERAAIQDPAPDLPMRSPKRLNDPCTPHHHHCPSQDNNNSSSDNSDFASASQSHYSPNRALPSPIRLGRPARAGSSTLGRMAPPILGHHALTATTHLNDLSFYLKNTGPSVETHGQGRKKKAGLGMFKVGGKKSLVQRVGSVEGGPRVKMRGSQDRGQVQTERMRPVLADCAREMTTTSGVKHLRIVIPSDRGVQDVALPVARSNSKRRSRHVSISWTEEMLNPLASHAIERVIADCNAMGTMGDDGRVPVIIPLESPRGEVGGVEADVDVDVDSHPLATRKEVTRARKLSDLRRMKRSIEGFKSEHTTTEAPERCLRPVRMGSVGSDGDSVKVEEKDLERKDEEHDRFGPEDEDLLRKIGRLQQRALALQRQNRELAEALARIIGYEVRDGDELGAMDVLRVYRQLGIGRGLDQNQMVERKDQRGGGFLGRNGEGRF